LEELRKSGVSDATIARTIVIEFGSEASAFDAISPAHLFVNEEAIPLTDLDANFT